MAKFLVSLRFHGRTSVEVEAPSAEQAYDKVTSMEMNGEIEVPDMDVEIEFPEEISRGED